MMIVLFIAFLFAFGISFISTRYMINIAKKFQLIDDKKTRFHPAQIHTGSIPRGGGIPIFLGITIPILLFLPHTPPYIAINGSLLILAIVGILDDKKDVHPYIRLITNAFAVIIAIVSGIRIPFFTNPIGEDVIMLDQY
ncbi:MAG: hypothetical protein N3A54_07300, partial [Patescibacteria group bacterium]|nr:hypothetical protein [Patescibacteria group bacterium]